MRFFHVVDWSSAYGRPWPLWPAFVWLHFYDKGESTYWRFGRKPLRMVSTLHLRPIIFLKAGVLKGACMPNIVMFVFSFVQEGAMRWRCLPLCSRMRSAAARFKDPDMEQQFRPEPGPYWKGWWMADADGFCGSHLGLKKFTIFAPFWQLFFVH